jgi:hypothetical protein
LAPQGPFGGVHDAAREARMHAAMDFDDNAYNSAMPENFFSTLERKLLIRGRFKSQASERTGE